jgi:hypothetical protein
MDNNELQITIYDKERGYSAGRLVEKMGDNKFKLLENDVFTPSWNRGMEFEATLNSSNEYEIVRITRESPFITRRFFLSTKYNQTDYEFVGSELVKIGGFWQSEFGIVTINIPKESGETVNKIIEDFGFYTLEIVDD